MFEGSYSIITIYLSSGANDPGFRRVDIVCKPGRNGLARDKPINRDTSKR